LSHHGESIWAINRGSHENKPNTPITDHENKWWKREKNNVCVAMSSDVLHFVCFGEETWNCMHFLVILSLKTLWAGVKRWRTALHRFYVNWEELKWLQICEFLIEIIFILFSNTTLFYNFILPVRKYLAINRGVWLCTKNRIAYS
jgi:hypothetical protein